MNKKPLFALMRIAIAVAFVLLMMLPVSVLADEATGNEGGVVTSDEYGMTMSKYVRVQEDGTYIIDLEAFAIGQVETTVSTAPADIILVLDVSGSMADHMYSYTARASQSYTYNNYGNNQYYYLHSDGNYYQVSREGNNNRRLRFRVGQTNWYLNADGTASTTYVTGQDANATLYTGVLYEQKDEGSKIAALKSAVNGFLKIVAEKNAASEVASDPNLQSRVAIVKLAYDKYNDNYDDYTPGDHHFGGNNYNYTEVFKDLTIVKQSDLETANTGWYAQVNSLTASGATAADYAMGYAEAIYKKHPLTETDVTNGRSRVVVMFTDGEPNHQSGFVNSVARDTVNTANTLKKAEADGGYGAKVFSVAIFEGADPSDDPGTTNINKYLHAVSSNYPTATATVSNNQFTVTNGARAEGNHFFTATTASQLEGIFAAIAHSSGSSGSTVNATAVLKDIVSSSFTLPPNATEDNIHVSIVRWNSYTHAWGTENDTTGGPYVFTPAAWKTASTTYGAKSQEEVAIEIDGSNVNVTGFDYATHYKATKPIEDNDAIDKVGGVNKNTAKVVISFEIDAKPSAVTGGKVATNGEESGLYVDGELVIKFPQPDVVFTPVTYVVDYVTSDTSTDTKASSVKLDYTGVLSNVEMLDKPDDDILKGVYAADFEYTIYTGRYGTISFGDDEVDVQRRYVRYAPTTMNWDGYDRIFVKGPSKSEDEKDVWAMLCVIPANSVFYEDTYITQTKTVTYNDEPVTIKYTGIAYTGDWNTVGTEGKNQTQHAGDEMGWISGLADDYNYANDMAHTSSTAKAKATFTFSGTGVDLYSRTNGSTGTVLVTVKSTAADNESGKKVTQTQVIDTKAAAGDFFAVPVCSFTDLPYGKYTATITVTTAGQSEGRMTFYLDGVRVYNPIKPLEEDGNVQMMYGEKNLNAVFTEVRSLLGTGAIATALYIDEHTTNETVTDVDAIEAAAKALSEAQQARDKYVEEKITPAKNDVNASEYALESAQSALNSEKAIYDVAVSDYNKAKAAAEADPENEELQAALAAAEAAMSAQETKVTEAQTAYNTAKAKYDGEIDGLNDALNAAIAGRATYDAAVEAARAAYDEANDGVVLAQTTTNVEVYNKEGPKTEVLLSKNQQVAINVESGKYYYIGLKSLKGDEVTVSINNKTVKLSHTTDLYYECTPESDSSTIVIKNISGEGSDAILSVTKLRTTGTGNTTSGTKEVSTETTLKYVRSLAMVPVTNYIGETLTEYEVAAGEANTVEESAEQEIMLDESDIVIDNPETSSDSEVIEEAPTTQTAQADSDFWNKLLSSFFGFFRR